MNKKTKIPPQMYILIGLFISLASYLLDKQRGTTNLRLFMIVGAIFFIFGIFKLVINYATNLGKKEKKHYKHTPDYYKKHHEYKFCPKCGSKLREEFNFCYNCGEKVM